MKLLCVNDRSFNDSEIKLINVTKGKLYTVLEKQVFNFFENYGFGPGLHYCIKGDKSVTWVYHSRFRLFKLNKNITVI
jgi:hypothetical protein